MNNKFVKINVIFIIVFIVLQIIVSILLRENLGKIENLILWCNYVILLIHVFFEVKDELSSNEREKYVNIVEDFYMNILFLIIPVMILGEAITNHFK